MTNGEKFKTAKERMEAFKYFCEQHKLMGCRDCPCWQVGKNWGLKCTFLWLDLEAEEEKPDNCPFCGTPTKAEFRHWEGENKFSVMCDFCGYTSGYSTEKQEAIARHNELCRKVKGGES